jgi:hypothetical protein
MKKKIRGKGQIIKQKQNTILSKMSLNSIQIQRKRDKIDTPITKIHVCSLFWLGTGRLVKGGVVKLVI